MNKSTKIAGYLSAFLSVAILAGSVWAVWQRQYILDWWRLRDYEPSAAIVQLSQDASFNELGEKLFYVHDPQLLDKDSFGGSCSLTEETIVLGCYITHDQIFIFDVDDERLEGVEQVTAAHEMLHAAYDRLSPTEKDDIDAQLQAVFERLDDERLKKNVAAYRERDPSVVPNELHSILPTEVEVLTPELEEYYARYFDDRLVVVRAAQSYEEEFTRREDAIESLDDRLAQLDASIRSDQVQIEQIGVAIDQERAQLEALRNTDTAAYNAGVAGFNSLIRDYNAQVGSYRTLIDSYNELVAERNSIALEEKELIEAIDTRDASL